MQEKTGSNLLRNARRIVVKVGSSLVTNEGRGLDEAAIGDWCKQLAALNRDGREVIMVSSGAIAEGMKRLGWAQRPKGIHELQAAAAVGSLSLATLHTCPCAASAAITFATSSPTPSNAAIAPTPTGTAACIASPRNRNNRAVSLNENVPAAA